jgi:hypothetical protein
MYMETFLQTGMAWFPYTLMDLKGRVQARMPVIDDGKLLLEYGVLVPGSRVATDY